MLQSFPSASTTGGSEYPAGPQTRGQRSGGTYCPAQWVTDTSGFSVAVRPSDVFGARTVGAPPPTLSTWLNVSAGAAPLSWSHATARVPFGLWSAHGYQPL